MTAFLSCQGCDGRGFLRSGDFYHRTFPRCKVCQGLGQAYLEEPKAQKDLFAVFDEPLFGDQ